MALLGPRSWTAARWTEERRQPAIHEPAWVKQFRRAYLRAAPSSDASSGLLVAFLPLLEPARRRVAEEISKSDMTRRRHGNRESLLQSFENNLFALVITAASRTLALELGVASKRRYLVGRNPEERFQFFCGCLRDPVFSSHLLSQYPVLVRRVGLLVAQWETVTIEFLRRFSRDRKAIYAKIFEGADPGTLTFIESLGDSHSGGRTVQRLTFESGNRLIYKPRSVAMEAGFYDFVEWFDRVGIVPDLRAASVLDREDYGWVRTEKFGAKQFAE